MARPTVHGDSRRGARAPEWLSWSAMMQRVHYAKAEGYKRLYIDRGITVCERWLRYENFLADMGRKPTPKHSIDRIDNDKGYEPGNCRWATAEEQMNNTTVVRKLTFDGVALSVSQWARRLGISPTAMRARLKIMSVDEAITKPVPKRSYTR